MQETIKILDNEIYIVGDTHSITVFRDIIEKTLPEKCTVVHIGDCGVGFSRKDSNRLIKVNEACQAKNITALIIRGNHDNPFYWNDFYKLTNVKLVKDYTRLIFPNGKEALCVGGGLSVDRLSRMQGVSYWSDEVTPYKPEYCTKCDYIFMHDAPSYCNLPTSSLKENYQYYCNHDTKLLEDAHFQRQVIDKIVILCQPTKIIGGHFHNTKLEHVNGIEYRSLDINEVYTFRA